MGKIKWTVVLISLVYIALGILFIIRPKGVEEALCYVLAAAVALLGLLYLAGYFITSRSEEDQGSNGFAIGILLVMMAVFIAAKQDLIITLVPFLFGVMVMIRGLFTIQNAFMIKRLGFPMSFPLLMGLVIMAFGLFLMLFPLEMGQMLFILIGCGLLAAGISGIIEMIVLGSMHRRRVNERERLKDMGPAVTTYDEKLERAEASGKAKDAEEAAEAAEPATPDQPEEAAKATDADPAPDEATPEA